MTPPKSGTHAFSLKKVNVFSKRRSENSTTDKTEEVKPSTFRPSKMSLIEGLSLSETEAMKKLKESVRDIMKPEMMNDDSLFLRFLRARDFVVKKSEDMLRNHISWRRAYQIDTFLEDFTQPEVSVKYLPFSQFGFDVEGAPVRYVDFGNMDLKGMLKSVKKMDCVKAVIHYLEEDTKVMEEQSKMLGRRIDRWIYIFNFDGYNFAKATHKPSLELLIYLFMMYESNYPERLKAAYIINASVYFTILFTIIKPLLSGATLKKLSIFGKDGWKEELLRNIDPEVLPTFLGGKRTDPDGNPLCSTIIKHGSLVPEEYYISKTGTNLAKQPGVQKMTVARMSKEEILLNVQEVGSAIEWEFETESKDIGFGLFYKENDSKESKEELIPRQRIDTHLTSETGMFRCDTSGVYILEFDNSYSWLQHKDIYYRASVVTPKSHNVMLQE